MIDALLNQTAAPALHAQSRFTAARHKVLAGNIVNASTASYRQRDLDEGAFRDSLRRKLSGGEHTSATAETVEPQDTLVFHDGNRRSMEHLMTEQAKNAMKHNLGVELLRKQYALFHMAVRERVA